MPIAFRFRQLPDDELPARARQIGGRVAGHHLFTDPDPEPAVVMQQAGVLEGLTGTGAAVAEEALKRERRALEKLLRSLGLYVLRPAHETKPLFITAGFDSLAPLLFLDRDAYIAGFHVASGASPGSIRLTCAAQPGNKAWLFQYTAADVITEKTEWTTTARARHSLVLEDLPGGVAYHFRMATIGVHPNHAYSEAIRYYVS